MFKSNKASKRAVAAILKDLQKLSTLCPLKDKEIHACLDNILQTPVLQARYFRESAPLSDIKRMDLLGVVGYIEERGFASPTLVANHLKRELRKVEGGLIPDAMQPLITAAFDIPTCGSYPRIMALLSVCLPKLAILQRLSILFQRILLESSDSITPTALASVFPVSDDKIYPSVKNVGDAKIQALEWAKSLAAIFNFLKLDENCIDN